MNYRQIWLQRSIDFLVRLENKLRRTQMPDIAQDIPWAQFDAEQLTLAAPCFVLSTGRCGTLWLTELLRLSRYAQVNHADYPELIRPGRLAYEQYEQEPRVFCEIIRATRDEFIARAYRYDQVYVETNNRITFFAPAIKQVYPEARFIHLLRHPGDFVRSGLNRKWYTGQQRHDLGRIVRRDPPGLWQTMSDVEKIAWLWNETNRFIKDFVAELDEQDCIQVRAEDMFSDPTVALNVCKFIGVDDVEPEMVAKMLKRRINVQRKVAVGSYKTWANSQKECVRNYAPLAAHYGYEL
jgi:hypothetical protein